VKLQERRRLHGLTSDQLRGELAESERALLDFRFDAGLNRLSNPAGMHNARKRIAVLYTLIREKELLQNSGFATMDEYKIFAHAEHKAYADRKKVR